MNELPLNIPGMKRQYSFFSELQTYIRDKGGQCSHENLTMTGLKLYLFEIPEKMLKEVVIPEIERMATDIGWAIKVQEDTILVRNGVVRWAEIIIA